jgi:hypothetical protein
MSRVLSKAEIARIKRRIEAEEAILHPDDDVTVSVSKISPPRNGLPDWHTTRRSKAQFVD